MRFILSITGCLLASAACAQAQKVERMKLHAVGDQEILLRRGYSVDNNCVPLLPTKIAIITAPKNGTITERPVNGFPSYDKDNSRFKCNEKRVEGVGAFYKAKPGFKGVDKVEFGIVYYDGDISRFSADISVW